MKKVFVIILALICCVCFACACSKDTDSGGGIPGDNPGGIETPGDGEEEPGDNPGGIETPGGDNPGGEDPGDNPGTDTPVDPGHEHSLVFHAGEPAGCEKAGTKDYWQCEGCGAKFLDEEGEQPAAGDDLKIPALNHSFGEWVSEGKNTHIRTCSRCTKVEREDHKITDNACTVCDFALQYTEGLEYQLNGDYYSVTGRGTASGDITVPYTYNGLLVKQIEKYAFNGEINITGIYMPGIVTVGDYAFYGCTSLVKAEGGAVTGLGKSAFSGCSSLNEVSFGNLKEAGDSAFSNCAALEEIDVSGLTRLSVNLFYGCENLSRVTLSQNLESIGTGSFSECTSLESIDLPNRPVKIGNSAFYGSAVLNNPELKENGLTYIGTTLIAAEDGVSGAVTVKEGTLSIAAGAFNNKPNLTGVILPEGLKIIGDGAFAGSTALKSVNVPQSVTYLGASAFNTCRALESIILYEGITAVGDNTFMSCAALTDVEMRAVTEIGESAFEGSGIVSLTLPQGAVSIGKEAFMDCTALKSVTLPESLISIGTCAFRGCTALETACAPGVKAIYSQAFAKCEKLTVFDLPATLTTLEDYAFERCTSLKYAELPEGLKATGTSVYSGCTSLEWAIIPDSMTEINKFMFNGCSSLEWIVIGKGVKHIGNYAFEEVSRDAFIYYKGANYEELRAIEDDGGYLISMPNKYYYYATRPEEGTLRAWCYVDGKPTEWAEIPE